MGTADSTTPPISETGNTLAEFETGSGTHKMLLVLMPVVAAFFVVPWIAMLTKWDWDFRGVRFTAIIVGTVLLLGLATPFLVGWILALSARRWRLLLCQNGILIRKRRSSRWIPWQAISEYYEKNVIINGVSTGHQIYFRLRNGKKASIDVIFKDPATISRAVKDQVVRRLIGEGEADLSQGQAVHFKYVKLDRHGLQTKGELTPWSEVQSVAIEDNKGLNYQLRVRCLRQEKTVDRRSCDLVPQRGRVPPSG